MDPETAPMWQVYLYLAAFPFMMIWLRIKYGFIIAGAVLLSLFED